MYPSIYWTHTNGAFSPPDGTLDYKGVALLYKLIFTVNSWKDDFARNTSGLVVGKTYTYSLWAKLGTAANFVASLENGSGVGWNYLTGCQRVVTTAGWQKISITFVAPSTGKVTIFLGSNAFSGGAAQTAGSVYCSHFKLEEGNKDTSWSPAPEDSPSNTDIISTINLSTEAISISAGKINLTGYITATNLSTSGQTTINGANITTGSLSADKIYGGTLTLGGAGNVSGILTIKNATGAIVGTLNNTGLSLTGDIQVGNIINIGLAADTTAKRLKFTNSSNISCTSDAMTLSANSVTFLSGYLGFFSVTAVSKQTATHLLVTATLADVIAKVNGVLDKLGLYGLFTVT